MSGPSQFANPKLNSEDTKTRFTDYVVLVTGGCSGIGKATLERFANDGATVYALDIRYQNHNKYYNLISFLADQPLVFYFFSQEFLYPHTSKAT